MKKLLAMLGAAGLVVSTSAVLVSCGDKEPEVKTQSIEFKDAEFGKKAKKDTVKLTEVKLVDEKIEGITLSNYELSEDGMKVSGKLEAPKDLAAGEYTVTLTADVDSVEAVFEDVETTTATFTFKVEEKTVDTSKLEEAIEAAKLKMEGVVVSVDGTDIAKDVKWSTQDELDKITSAIEAAESLMTSEDQDEINTGVTTLETATNAFEPKLGTKDETPESPIAFFYQA